jgi:hypothetical protein
MGIKWTKGECCMVRSHAEEETSEPVVNSAVRELCKAISQEEDSRRMASLLDELLRLLDERQLMMSLL